MYDYSLAWSQEGPIAVVDHHHSESIEQESRHPSKVRRVRVNLVPCSFLTSEFGIDSEFNLAITDLHIEQKGFDCRSTQNPGAS